MDKSRPNPQAKEAASECAEAHQALDAEIMDAMKMGLWDEARAKRVDVLRVTYNRALDKLIGLVSRPS